MWAGTIVIRKAVTQAEARQAGAARLPFATGIIICNGREVLRLMEAGDFAEYPVRPDLVRFVSVLPRMPRFAPPVPFDLPAGEKRWLVKVVGRHGRFVLGLYRREMKAIQALGGLDRALGAQATTRNWNTMMAIARVLGWRGGGK
jgi:hypothetical protein